jgi:hypothetical protein
VILSTGTLYGEIKRLLARDWIQHVEDPLPNGTDRERKPYNLTLLRRRSLNAEIARLKKLVNVAKIQTAGIT